MKSVDAVLGAIRRLVSHRGHVRLFILASVVWMAIAAPVFWKPLPYVYNSDLGQIGDDRGVDLSSKQREVCQGSGFGSEQAQQRERVDCYDGVEQLVNHDVAVGTFMQLLAWASTVLFVPIILPLLLSLLAISGAVIFQWISDGYRNGSPTDSQ